MKKRTTPLLIIFLFFFTAIAVGQDISLLKNVDISNLSDDQIESYWASIQKRGIRWSKLRFWLKLKEFLQ